MTIRSWMERDGLKQREVAERLGISLSLVNALLTGARGVSKELAASISVATGGDITISELLYPDGLPEGACLAPSPKPGEAA